MSSSDDSDDDYMKNKRSKGRRGRRGFSKKSSTESTTDTKTSIPHTNSAIYSSCVSKCFSSIYTRKFELEDKTDDGSDVEDDLLSKSPVLNDALTMPHHDLLVLSDDEDVENSQNSQNTASKPEIFTIVSPSPPPPPPPDGAAIGGGRGRRPRQTKQKRNLYTAVDKLTRNLSDAQSQLLDDSLDADVTVVDDDIVTVRMDYLGKIRRFTIKSKEPFSTIIRQMSASEDVCERAIMLVHNDKTLRPTDSPGSIKLHTADIIKCHVKQNVDDMSNSFNDSLVNEDNDADVIELCLQSSESRQKLIIKAHKSRPLSTIMQEYASRVNKDLFTLQFLFDGEALQMSDTPDSLDMDDGDILDVRSAAHSGVKSTTYDYSLVVIE